MKYRILSVDWDYFVNATLEERFTLFPDGGNERINGPLANAVWTSRYAEAIAFNKGKDIRTISYNEPAYIKLLSYLKKPFTFISVDSHKYLGEFILEYLLDGTLKIDELEIVNIDHHSDLYDPKGERPLDCGNWLNKVLEQRPDTKVTWVCNEDSVYDEVELTLNDLPNRDTIKITTDFSAAEGDYDLVFLCRSDVWSPPHLDKYFLKMDRSLRKRAERTITDVTLDNRWNVIENEVDTVKAQFEKFNLLNTLNNSNIL